MKGKKLASVLLSLGMVAAFATTGVVASCSKKTDPGPYSGPKAEEFVNKTPADQAKVIYIGEASGNKDGTSPQNAYDINKFFNDVAIDDANTILVPGTIVKVRPGVHRLENPLRLEKSGSYNDYIIFEAEDPTKETVFDFRDMRFGSNLRGVEIYSNYIYWRNIDICGAGDNGLYIGGSYNIVENCEFYNNRDTGLQLGRSYGDYTNIRQWPSYNLIKNCTSYNNYDNETYGENADGFAAKLTVGYGNIFDGCIAYRNSDDGWDLYGKSDTGVIGRVIIYNCVAFENGFLQKTQKECNDWFGDKYNKVFDETNTNSYTTRDGDGNGFKLGGSTLAGDVYVENCLSFNNRMHGLTDNSNPGQIEVHNYTAFNNGALIDDLSYLNIHDEGDNDEFTKSFLSDGTPKSTVVKYYNVNQDGYIIDEAGNKIILDASRVWNTEKYIAVKDGKIYSDSDCTVPALDNDGNQIAGDYVKIDTTKSTKNDNFGQIRSTLGNDEVETLDDRCNNLDIERSAVSYNAFSGVLSAVSGLDNNFTGSDRYRGSASNSVLAVWKGKNVWKRYEITDPIDADWLNKKTGEEKDFVAASEIFSALPTNSMGMDDKSSEIHETYRNEDGSINMGNILKVKDYGKLLGEDNKIGCNLSMSSWSEYPHYDYTYMTDGNYVKNDSDAPLRAVQSLLYVQTDTDATYQNFMVPTEMLNCKISWTSSNTDILKVGEGAPVGVSYHTIAEVDVTRPEKDTQVTLTATITSNDSSTTLTKEFVVNVKQINYEIGDIEVEGLVGGNIIMKQFDTSGEPPITVHNAADYSGKLIPEGSYEVETTYYFAETKGGQTSVYPALLTNVPGVYTVQKTIRIGDQEKSFEYTIFIVSDEANLEFMKSGSNFDYTLAMRHDGFNISGTLTNVSGSMYVYATATGAQAPTKDQVKANGEKVDITWDSISFDFKHDNSAEYNIYFVLCNPKGDITSDLHSVQVKIQSIGDTTAFANLIKTGGDSSIIYQLTADLDYANVTWTPVKASDDVGFRGLFDGRGHTIKNIKSTSTSGQKGNSSVFPMISGGAIMNVNFENISIEGYQDLGIIAQAKGGYIYNVNMKNINVHGNQRVAALVGHVYEQNNAPLIIDRVSLVNENSEISGEGKSARAAGLIGFVQTNNGAPDAVVEIQISNCYIDADIGTLDSGENGAIVATYDTDYNNANTKFSLEISNCVVVGTVKASTRCGGIVGYHKGLSRLSIYGCVSLCELYHAGVPEPLAVPQKNCSGIMGGYSSSSEEVLISWCYSKIAEHNSKYDVTVIEEGLLSEKNVWTNNMAYDMENVWEFVTDGDNIVEPYVRLRTITF